MQAATGAAAAAAVVTNLCHGGQISGVISPDGHRMGCSGLTLDWSEEGVGQAGRGLQGGHSVAVSACPRPTMAVQQGALIMAGLVCHLYTDGLSYTLALTC